MMDLKLLLHIAIYCVTGAVQPTLINYVARSHSDDEANSPFTLFPVLATALGMMIVYPIYVGLFTRLQRCRRRYCRGGGRALCGDAEEGEMMLMTRKPQSAASSPFSLLSRLARGNNNNHLGNDDDGGGASSRPPYRLALLDLVSSSLVVVGLVYVGAATYTVIYSSAAAFTAIIGRKYFNARALNAPQIAGIVLVTLGLVVNGVAHAVEDSSEGGGGRREFGMSVFAFGAGLLLMGTILHSVVMLSIDVHSHQRARSEEEEENGGVDHHEDARSLRLASELGRIEIVALLFWNLARWWLGRVSLFTLPMRSWIFYAVLTLNAALHAMAFFSFIGRLGAVGSSVLKGFLSLFVFGLAGYLFCERSHTEQCLTPAKASSMLMVFTGGVVYSLASSKYYRYRIAALSRENDAGATRSPKLHPARNTNVNGAFGV